MCIRSLAKFPKNEKLLQKNLYNSLRNFTIKSSIVKNRSLDKIISRIQSHQRNVWLRRINQGTGITSTDCVQRNGEHDYLSIEKNMSC